MTMHLRNCIVESLPAQAYHSDDAVGSSLGRKLQSTTPMHAKEMLETPMASLAMAAGSALHAAMLEPENDLAQAVITLDGSASATGSSRRITSPSRLAITN